MNKRLRSRVLAASIFSTTLMGGGGMLYPLRALQAQERPTASQMLDRGAALYDQKNFADAKKVLTDIDPAQLPENERGRLTDLLTKTDTALSAAMGPNQKLDAAQQDQDAGRLADAATKYQALIDDNTAPSDVKQQAQIQLALVKQKQTQRVPEMKELLNQAQSLYDQGKLDDAQAALAKVRQVGGDLGWDTDNRLPDLERKISEKRLAMARGAGGNGVVVTAATTTGTEPAAAQAMPNPMDVQVTPMAGVTGQAPAAATEAAGGTVAPTGAMQRAMLDADVLRQRAIVQYREAQRQAHTALDRGQYQQAISYAQQSMDIVDTNRSYFSDVEAEALHDASQALLDNANIRYQTAKEEQERSMQAKLEAEQNAHNNSLAAERQAHVASLVADARKLYEAAKFNEAESLLEQAVVIDPQNENAKLFLRLTQDKITDRQYQNVVDRAGTEMMRQNIDSAEHLIPYADLMIYPDNWPDITRRRTNGLTTQDSEANRVAREKLEGTLTQINADQQGLEKVLNYLRQSMGANIFVNWPVLQTAGIDRNTPVTIDLSNVPYRKALSTILSQVGGDTAHLGYTIDDGIITISTQDDLNSTKYQTVKVFDIRDMLVQPIDKAAPQLNLQSLTGGGTQSFSSGQNGGGGGGFGGGGFGGGGGSGGFGSSGGGGGLFGGSSTTTSNAQQNAAQKGQDLVDLITSVIRPNIWSTNGGTATIKFFSGKLIVTAPVSVQEAIGGEVPDGGSIRFGG